MDSYYSDVDRVLRLLSDYSSKIRFFYYQIERLNKQIYFSIFSMIFTALSLAIKFLFLEQANNTDWFFILVIIYGFCWFSFFTLVNKKKSLLLKQELEEICVKFEKVVLEASHFHERGSKENTLQFLELDTRLSESERLLRRAETYISLKKKI